MHNKRGWLVVVLVALAFCSAVAQQSGVISEAEYQKLGKKAEKERLKQDKKRAKELAAAEAAKPASARIAATPEKIKGALVDRMTSEGYAIVSDSTYQIAFWKDVPAQRGFLGYLMFGEALPQSWRLVPIFIVSPQSDGTTSVTTSASATVQNGYGNQQSYVVTAQPAVKKDLQGLLDQVKSSLEQPAAAAAETKN